MGWADDWELTGAPTRGDHSRNAARRCYHDGFARVLVERLEVELELKVPEVLELIA